jgi:hypothetical protein
MASAETMVLAETNRVIDKLHFAIQSASGEHSMAPQRRGVMQRRAFRRP